jgi:hypothetical protein
MKFFLKIRVIGAELFHVDVSTDRLTDTDRQTERRTDRQADRQTDRETDRQTDRESDMTKIIVVFAILQMRLKRYYSHLIIFSVRCC